MESGELDALILATLVKGTSYGYAIIEELKARAGGELQIPVGTVYPALHRLERDGLLASQWSTEAGRPRRVYRLTDRGTRELENRRAPSGRRACSIDSVRPT